MGHPSVSWKSTSRKVRRSQASFSSGRSRNTPSKTGAASGGASSNSSASLHGSPLPPHHARDGCPGGYGALIVVANPLVNA
jgi:hypothetical protein